MQGETAPDRRLILLSGKDTLAFLQGLVTNDVLPLARGPGLVWAALLTPQGKYLVDFFVVNTGTDLLLDLPDALAETTLRRLAMYRLRADVQFAPADLHVTRGLVTPPAGAMPDPRHPALGWRSYGGMPGGPALIDWDAIRVAHCIPQAGIELIPDDSYILEAGFERLHGVDFRKGCYVGQEVTARMKHKTDLRKGLARVRINGQAGPGAEITAQGKPVGRLCSISGDQAIAYLRFDRVKETMLAGQAQIDLQD